MKVRFKASFNKYRVRLVIDEDIEGPTPDAIMLLLREEIANRVPRIPFVKQDNKLRAQLRTSGTQSWTAEEFFKAFVDYYNENMLAKGQERYAVPHTAEEFIDLLVRLGLAIIKDSDCGYKESECDPSGSP